MLADIGKKILEGIRALDAQLGPLGIYASDRGLLFTKVIYPEFKSRGYRVASFSKAGRYAYLETTEGKESERLELLSVAKIKVRKFGSRHRLDPSIAHEE